MNYRSAPTLLLSAIFASCCAPTSIAASPGGAYQIPLNPETRAQFSISTTR